MRKFTLLFALFSLHSAAFAANYYVDHANGSDANTGTCETAAGACTGPWQNAPGMQGCAGTCASTTLQSADSIVFKGGITWPNTDFPLVISSGTYYGVDTTWFDSSCGASFCQPIFSMQGQVVASTNVAIIVNVNNLQIDNLEITSMTWTGSAQAGAIFFNNIGLQDTLTNLNINNWAPQAGATDVFQAVASSPSFAAGLYDSFITGLPGSSNSGTGVYNIPIVSSCTIHDLSSGVVSTKAVLDGIAYSRIYNINASFDGVSPSRAIQTVGVTSLYSNYIHDFASATQGIVTQPSYLAVSAGDSYINNLIWNTGSKTPLIMDTSGPTASQATPYIINNTIVQDTNGYCVAVGLTNSGTLGNLTFENNQCISDISASTGMLCTISTSPGGCAATASQAQADNLLMSHALATTDNYTLADLFSPTASTSPTVMAGIHPSGLIYSGQDIRGAPRPSFNDPYDIGAYQYCAGCGYGIYLFPTAAIRSITPETGTAPFTASYDASLSTAPNATITDYFWTFGDGSTADSHASPTTSHTFTTVGVFHSSVTITTSLGDMATNWADVISNADTATLTLGNATATAGTEADVGITFTPSTDDGTTSMQFDLSLPTGVSYSSGTLSPAAVSAGIQFAANPAVPSFVIFGSSNAIPSGLVLTVHLSIAANASPGSDSIGILNMRAVDVNAFIIPLTGIGANLIVTQGTGGGGGGGGGSGVVFSPRAYPSPWRSDRDNGAPITFDQLAGNSTIKIFTTAGHLVRSLSANTLSTTWDLNNDSGASVASGLYFYVITNDQGQKSTGKFAIIR